MEHLHTQTDIPNSIQVLHIKTRRQEFEFLPSCPNVTYQNLEVKAHDADTRELEQHLGRFPDLYRFRHDVDLRYRRLFQYRVTNTDGNSFQDYYIYKWIEPTGWRLPENHYVDYTNAYGPAFVFTRHRTRRRDREGLANFDPLRHFAESLDWIHAVDTLTEDMLRDEMVAKALSREEILRRLLRLQIRDVGVRTGRG